MRKYMVYMDDGKCFKLAVPAKNEKEARACVAGNGEIIAVKDVTAEYPISVSKIADALAMAHFGQTEISFVTRCLAFSKVADVD